MTSLLLAEKERVMWRAVIAQAVKDATEGTTTEIVQEAREWLTIDSWEFRLVCEWAGFEPEDVRDRAKRLEDRGWDNSNPMAFSI